MSTDSSEVITAAIEERRQEILDFAGELIATPSETPPGDERRITAAILSRLERLGLKGAQIVGAAPERPNVLYKLKGSGGGPTLLYNGHMDTKPVGDARDQWQTDPFPAGGWRWPHVRPRSGGYEGRAGRRNRTT